MVVQSPAIAFARHARARPPPPGPAAQPPTLPPSSSSRRAEPRPPPPRLVPSGLNTRSPHPCQEFREPPCPPPPPPPNGDNDANDQRSVDATMDPPPEDDRPQATQSTSSSSPPPTTGGGEGRRTLRPVTPRIMQTLCRVPPRSHPLSSSLSAGDLRGGSGGGGGWRVRRQRQKRQRHGDNAIFLCASSVHAVCGSNLSRLVWEWIF